MREPIVPKDSFWGDFFNALFFRNVHREDTHILKHEPEGEHVDTATSEGTLSPEPEVAAERDRLAGNQQQSEETSTAEPPLFTWRGIRPLSPQEEVYSTIEKAMNDFNDTDFSVISLSLHGRSNNDIANELSISQRKVQATLRTVQQRLQEALVKHVSPESTTAANQEEYVASSEVINIEREEPSAEDLITGIKPGALRTRANAVLNDVASRSVLNDEQTKAIPLMMRGYSANEISKILDISETDTRSLIQSIHDKVREVEIAKMKESLTKGKAVEKQTPYGDATEPEPISHEARDEGDEPDQKK